MSAKYPRLHVLAASFWREWHRELRRQAGDERLPYQIRVRLRHAADRALRRSAVEEQRGVVPRWNRRALADAAPTRLSADDEQRGRRLAMECGIVPGQPIVTVEIGQRADRLSDAIERLSAEGFRIVRIGNPVAGPLRGRDVLDVASDPRRTPVLDLYLLLTSAFVVCSSAELQQAALIGHTPSLRIDAHDAFTAYPVRRDGIFTLATAVDLDTGRPLAIQELLTERYFRNSRNYGYRATSAAEITAAVGEMVEGVRTGWRESDAQRRFRQAVADAGVAMGHVRHVAEWDGASGFIGDGRLARVQAERAL
ncbi:MAG: TIGR04372 family glycosyltransferase [Acidobacteria bacterium]|nr:TIGR04372 family glycosyltransferase [Acidobacteriota bacterium]